MHQVVTPELYQAELRFSSPRTCEDPGDVPRSRTELCAIFRRGRDLEPISLTGV